MRKKLMQTQKTISNFVQQTLKNYKAMKSKLNKIWLLLAVIIISAACNVTRKVTTESSYYQKGDTAVTIQTKTVETYDATKKGM